MKNFLDEMSDFSKEDFDKIRERMENNFSKSHFNSSKSSSNRKQDYDRIKGYGKDIQKVILFHPNPNSLRFFEDIISRLNLNIIFKKSYHYEDIIGYDRNTPIWLYHLESCGYREFELKDRILSRFLNVKIIPEIQNPLSNDFINSIRDLDKDWTVNIFH